MLLPHTPTTSSSLPVGGNAPYLDLQGNTLIQIDTILDPRVDFEGENIYHIDGTDTDIELLLRPRNERPDIYLERAKINNATHIVAGSVIEEALERIEETQVGDIQINLYMWDLLNPEIQKKLRNFPHPERLVIELVEDISNRLHEDLYAQGIFRFMATLQNLGFRFAIDDYTFDTAARNEQKDSHFIFELLHTNMANFHIVERVKFDGPTMIRPVFELQGNAKEKHIRKLSKTIEDMKKLGVRYFIAEFVQNEDEIEELRKIGFTSFQGKYLYIGRTGIETLH